MKEDKIFEGKFEFPICVQQAKFKILERDVYSVPIKKFQTNNHLVIEYFRPISKLF
jgi:hypothetical protein